MRWLDWIMDWIVRGVGHPLMIPIGSCVVAITYASFGVDTANFLISIATFALLPVLQHSQLKGDEALHAKLDELIRTSNARNELIGLDHRTESEIKQERDQCEPTR